MNDKINKLTEKLKKGSKIHIKESQKGSFTKYCNGKVTEECIQRGKNSPDPRIRKKATFAANARKWKHQEGGNIVIVENPELKAQMDSTDKRPKLKDIVNFAKSFETFRAEPYQQETASGTMQTLAGYGSANPEIIRLAREGKLTEELASQEVERRMQKDYDTWTQKVPNFKNLPIGVRLALTDISYNGKGVEGTIKNSPNLMKLINSGVTDSEKLAEHLTHSKNAGGWLGVRSAARRAMALGKYLWGWDQVDKYGRQIDSTQYRGKEDWKASPYYRKYQDGGFFQNLKRKFWTHEKPLFDKEKIVKRVYGDNIVSRGGDTHGPGGAIWQYLFNDDNAVYRRIEELENTAKKYKNLSPSDVDNLSDKERLEYWAAQALPFVQQHEDAKRIYYGFPQLYGTMEKSKYKPTVGNVDKSYQIIPLLSNYEFNGFILPMYSTWKGAGMENPSALRGYRGMIPRIKEVKDNIAQLAEAPYLDNTTLSLGYDDKGQYLRLFLLVMKLLRIIIKVLMENLEMILENEPEVNHLRYIKDIT